MAHAQSLRVIGQSMEVARVADFELENDGKYYLVRSNSLTQTSEWILRNALTETDGSEETGRQATADRSLRFSPANIAWLDAQGQKKRNHTSSRTQGTSRLSQLLRTLGDHLDRTEVSAFNISWTANSFCVDYKGLNGQSDCREFTAEKLQQLGLHVAFRRSGSTRSDSPDLTPYVPATEFLKHTRSRNR